MPIDPPNKTDKILASSFQLFNFPTFSFYMNSVYMPKKFAFKLFYPKKKHENKT